MPAQIPDPDALSRVQARPSLSIASYRPGMAEQAQEGLGNEISRYAEQELAQINTTQAQDALNKLVAKKIDLTVGDNGFRSVTGGKVLDKDANGDTMLKTYPAQFNSAVSAIGAGLSGPAARLFNQRASEMGNQFQAEVMTHVMDQTDAYHKNTLGAAASTFASAAALDPTNPVAVQGAIQGIKDAVASYSANPRAQDMTAFQKAAISNVHNNVVDQAIAQGNPEYALTYFNQNKAEMSPQDILQAEGKLTYAKRQTAAIGAVSSAVDALGWKPGQPLPTQKQLVDASIANLGANPDPRDRETTIQEADRQYSQIVQAANVAKENAISSAQQEIIKNNGQVPLSAGAHQKLLTYAPEYAAHVSSFMDAVNPAKEVQTNIAAYNVAISHPDELARMSDADFLDFQTRNFSMHDREKIANIRADYMSGKPANSAANINTGPLNDAVNTRLASIGVNPRPATSDLNGQQRVAAIKHFITEDIYSQQAQLGRKMTGPEINQRVDQLFSQSTDLPGLIYGVNTKATLAMKAGDIPKDELAKVKDALSSVGVKAPTDDQVMNTYWKWKAKNVR